MTRIPLPEPAADLAEIGLSSSHTAAEIVEMVAGAAEHRQRPDLAERLRAGYQRQARPETIVCFVGEFKQGKSSLINALLEANICPVHDDIATAVPTVVRFAEHTRVTVHRSSEGRSTTTEIDPADLSAWVGEADQTDIGEGADYVEIAFEHPLLKDGLVLVDTPGVGGLNSAHAQATTAFLPFADALVFTTDASAELTATEIDFLTQAAGVCPLGVVALSKTDLYPHWRQIKDLDSGHLESAGCRAPIIATSASAQAAAIQFDDSGLGEESGIPALSRFLLDDVLDPSRLRSWDRLLSECIGVLDQIEPALQTELAVLNDPDSAESIRAHFEEVTERLQQVRDSAGRWHQVLNDGVTDLTSEMSFRFRSDIRQLNEQIDTEIEQLRTPAQWDELASSLQRRVSELTTNLFNDIDARTDALARRVSEVLRDDIGFSTSASAASSVDLISSALDPPKQAGGKSRSGGSAMGAMRGAQSGILLFGMLGRYLPMGATAILFSNPVTLVLGAAFAGKQVRAIRSQNLTLRRQQARSSVRSFLDNFQHEATNRFSEVMREQSRALRDHFTERAAELQKAAQTIAEQARADLASAESHRTKRVPVLEKEARSLAELREAIIGLGGQLGQSRSSTSVARGIGSGAEAT